MHRFPSRQQALKIIFEELLTKLAPNWKFINVHLVPGWHKKIKINKIRQTSNCVQQQKWKYQPLMDLISSCSMWSFVFRFWSGCQVQRILTQHPVKLRPMSRGNAQCVFFHLDRMGVKNSCTSLADCCTAQPTLLKNCKN